MIFELLNSFWRYFSNLSNAAKINGIEVPLSTPAVDSPKPIPTEVIIAIAFYLDSSTAASFSRVSRSFRAIAEPVIWSDLDFTIKYGPAGLPPDDISDWASSVDSREEEEQQEITQRAREKVKAILRVGDEEKWGKVKSLTVTPRAGTEHLLSTLVENISQSIVKLQLLPPLIDRSIIRTFEGFWEERGDSLDAFLLHLNRDLGLCGDILFFPHLTHVEFHLGSITSFSIISLLLFCSHQLSYLKFGLTDRSVIDSGYMPHHEWSLNPRLTPLHKSIRELSFYVDDHYQDMARTRNLIEASPHLKRLGIALGDMVPGSVFKAFWRLIMGLEELEVLNWRKSRSSIQVDGLGGDEHDDGQTHNGGFKSLRHLMIRHVEPIAPTMINVTAIYALPMLESIHLDCSTSEPGNGILSTLHFIPHTPDTLPIDPILACWLLRSPRLRYLRFFSSSDPNGIPDIDFANSIPAKAGKIRSWRYGDEDEELLHFQVLVREIDIIDPYQPSQTVTRRIVYREGDNRFEGRSDVSLREKPFWQDWTDFQGEAVDMEVIEEMRRVEGVAEDDLWDRRGMEVGETAWNVLLAARARMALKREAETLFGDDLYHQFSFT